VPVVSGVPVHPRQREFIEAFEAGDPEKMAKALKSIAEEFGGVTLSAVTRQDIEWSCREIVEVMVDYNHSLGNMIDLPEIHAHLMLNAFLQQEAQGGGRPSRVRLQLAPPATAPPDLKQRWMRLGLSAEALLVNRPSAPSGPQAGGPGHERVSIHRRQRVLGATPNQTYAYALSLQSKRQGQYLERYLAGDRNRVWAEFLELGETIRRETLLADATAVARETMRRCRTNVERLSERLLAVGYEFKNPDQALVSPSEKVFEQIADLEARVGPLPLSVCAWYEIVGSVDFTGSHPDWPDAYPDPLVVYPSDYILAYDEDNWYRGRYRLDMAPDPLHKENVSGGPPYAIWLPNAAVDAPFEDERHDTTFVNYLRICFQWGGFPGWEESSTRARPTQMLRDLAANLIPV